MSESAGRNSKKIEMLTADWLKPGWVFALRAGGGMHVSQVAATADRGARFAASILKAVEDFDCRDDVTAIIIAPEDAAIVSEHFPEEFRRSRKR